VNGAIIAYNVQVNEGIGKEGFLFDALYPVG
jgi:hypothetical protein